jgi:hypothetical protein
MLRADARMLTVDRSSGAVVRDMPCVLVSVEGVRGIGTRARAAARPVCVQPVSSIADMRVTSGTVMPMTRVAVMFITPESVGATSKTAVAAVFLGVAGGAAVPRRLRGAFKERRRGRRRGLLQRPSDGERAADLTRLGSRGMQMRVLLLLRVQVQPKGHAKHAVACGHCTVCALGPAPCQQPLLVHREVGQRVSDARTRSPAPVAATSESMATIAGVDAAAGCAAGVGACDVAHLAAVVSEGGVVVRVARHAAEHAVLSSRRRVLVRRVFGRGVRPDRRLVRLLMLIHGVLTGVWRRARCSKMRGRPAGGRPRDNAEAACRRGGRGHTGMGQQALIALLRSDRSASGRNRRRAARRSLRRQPCTDHTG